MNMQQDDPDELFKGISIDSIEENLITVDLPEAQQQQVEKELEDGQEPPEVETTEDKPEPTKKPAEEPADTTIVIEEEETEEVTTEAATTEDTKDKGGTPDDKEEDESPSYLHAAALQEEGVLPNLDIETLKDKKPEEIFQTINEHINTQMKEGIQSGIDLYKEGFGEKAKQFLEALDKGVPFEDLADNYQLEERYASIKESDLENDEELAKNVYADLLNIKGFAAPKITKMVEKAVQDGEIVDESKEGLKEINQIIKDDRAEQERVAQAQETERKEKNEEMKPLVN
jgi:hypothetical protein